MGLLYGVVVAGLLLMACPSLLAKAKKKSHPYDVYVHDMHTPRYEAINFSCENCHKDPASYGDKTKVNPMGCHMCHNSPNPPLPGPGDCTMCHADGFPKPESHKTDWTAKHQVYAKQDPAYCTQCHANQNFCIACHGRRDTVQEKMHRRNFKLYHSIEARANPRKCDACHTVNFCQECHAGRETSKR